MTQKQSRLVLFGAGNVGRSFVAQLFSRAGYEVVFVDVDSVVVNELNRRKAYDVIIRDRECRTIRVSGVRAVDAKDSDGVVRELQRADLVATSVGAAALPSVMRTLAMGLRERYVRGLPVIDVILAENLREAKESARGWLRESLPREYPDEAMPGLVETSIGKMVPITPDALRREDPLVVYAEAYNTLILDRNGFKGDLPEVPGLSFKTCMKAWVERKLFMHNLGHALLCYLGYLRHPDHDMIWQLLDDAGLRDLVSGGMMESAHGLVREYPEEFSVEQLADHAEELIGRFANRALGDTVYRVGRDLKRKLSRNERLVGAVVLGGQHGVDMPIVREGIVSGFFFRKADEVGNPFPGDREFAQSLFPRGPRHLLEHVCGLKDRQDMVETLCDDYSRIVKRTVL